MFTNQDGKQIDLLSFGEIENKGQVVIEGKGLTKVNLDGFKEAYTFGVSEIEIGEEKYKTCSMPGIVILKLIAYDDRPEMRTKDIVDIDSICLHYPLLESEFIWSDHFDLYDETLQHNEIGVIVLGREMQKLVYTNEELRNRLIHIMDKAISEKSDLLTLMIQNTEKETIEDKRHILERLKFGFTDKIN